MKNADVYEKVTAQIVAAMEKGVVPWERPWTGGTAPRNAITGRYYNGMNVWALGFQAMTRGYGSSGWCTFKQAIGAGLVVRKDEKGTPVFFMSKVEKKRTAAERAAKKKAETFFMAKLFYVFNLDQLTDLAGSEGAKEKLAAKLAGSVVAFDPIERAEAIVRESGAVVVRAGNAHYQPETDRIGMPSPTSFKKGAAGYYPVLFHELAHWTGAASRLARDLSTRFGSTGYAIEELVAELTAAFVANTVGLDHATRAASYLDNWLGALRDRPDAFMSAASAAQKAADFLLSAVDDREIARADDGKEAAEIALAVA